MSFNYSRMAATAKRLLTRFNQGELSEIVATVTPDSGDKYALPTTATTATTRQGVASGVSSKYVDGTTILSTDLMLTLEAIPDLSVDSLIQIDGENAKIIRVDQVPPAGVPVVTRVFVKG